MPWLPRLVQITLMTAIMVFAVTFVATLVNLGLGDRFLLQWMKAYFIAWPVAITAGFLIMPPARRMTERIVARIEAAKSPARS